MTSVVRAPQVVAALIELVPALLFVTVARTGSRYVRGRARRWLPHPGWLLALHYALFAVFRVTPLELQQAPPPILRLLQDGSLVVLVLGLAGFRHLQRVTGAEGVPSFGWRARIWGVAVAVAAFVVLVPRFAPLPGEARVTMMSIVLGAYCVAMGVVMLRVLRREGRPGRWRPGNVGGMSRRGLAFFAVGVLLLVALFTTQVALGTFPAPMVHAGVGVAFAVPVLLADLGQSVREIAIVLGTTGMAGAVVGVYFLAAPHAGAAAPAVLFVAVLVLVAAVIPGQTWLRATVDRLVFARGIGRRAALQHFLQTLSPADGPPACAARALERLVDVMQLRGAALLLRDGTRAAAGDVAIDVLAAGWRPTDAAAPPPALVPADYRTLSPSASHALGEAEIVGVIAVGGPRGRWGHLFITTTLFGNVFGEEDERALLAFADQLALVLDAAELLARTVQAERSLAHAQQLAAIGETAARIAHEIRNPITAARSLAQQLAREPSTPFAAEHGLILEELERVENQVRALLQFARREELRVERADLGALVRGTLASLAPRIEAAGVEVTLDTPGAVVAPIDREKMRQVVVNLVDNAVDALADAPAPRRLVIAAAAVDGVATLSVRDNGPGVPPDALPRLFEPFWSGKAHGTGLGLAIVRSAVEAHGGRIDARSTPGEGTTFEVVLPVRRTGA